MTALATAVLFALHRGGVLLVELASCKNEQQPLRFVLPARDRQQGYGLGLAISRSLASMHGGALKIRSKPGKGTIVSFQLPLQSSHAEETRQKDAA